LEAAAYFVFPACAAVTVQLPLDVKETVVPVTVQLPEAVKVTVNAEVAVAATVSGPGIVCAEILGKVIVCGTLIVLKVLVVRPELYVALESADAVIVHVPTATELTVPVA